MIHEVLLKHVCTFKENVPCGGIDYVDKASIEKVKSTYLIFAKYKNDFTVI